MSHKDSDSVQSHDLTLDVLVRAIGELPAAPHVLARALQLTADTETDINELGHVLSADQSLSARVLRLSNSPFYGRLREVKSITEALQVLGFETVRTVTIAASTHLIYRDMADGNYARTLWRHSLCTAIAAGTLAESYKMGDKESAYIAGLLHDIGKLVLHARAPHLFEKIVLEVVTSGREFCKIESEMLNFDHSDIASLMLSGWNIPSPLVRAIHAHHRQITAETLPANRLAHVVALADDIARRLNICFPGQKPAMTTAIIGDGMPVLDDAQLQSVAGRVRAAFELEVALF
ncbi:hypothetical protein C3F09_02610 [candidate division GN15 bacterium]|uniref:HDOD domain-containing protein n=1 Tax=candidate division GN15 bacterium TaxID=2072418 RepID=A0A855X5Y9_9BACT|nr:MAG: hypothetical protein C3F09_02610 [candidate division GN15 bacterium]